MKFSKFSIVKVSGRFLTLVLFALIFCCNDQQAQQPNVLFIFTDDQAANTIYALGNRAIQTPNIDQLVKKGTSFTNAYIMGSSSPAVCSPSRASLFSGLTLWNLENQGLWGYEISDRYKTLPQVFRENGYTTFATGKNEPGREGHFARSFNAGDKILFRGVGDHYRVRLCSYSPEGDYSKDSEVLYEGTHSAQLYADACIRFLENQKNNETPFFAYLSFGSPHDPRQSPEEFRNLYSDEEMMLPASYLPQHPFDNGLLDIRDEKLANFPRKPEEIKKHLADYYALITYTDHQIGRVIAALKASGMYKNTIIILSSDNGLAIGRHGLMGKQNLYEHSTKVPLIISGPGIPSGEIRDQLCYIYDIYPTLCERAGISVPGSVQFRSLNVIIDENKSIHRKQLYFAFMDWQRAIRKDNYKLIEYCVNQERCTQLFDLAKDPEEMENLAGEDSYDEKIQELRALLRSEREFQNDGNTSFEFTNNQGRKFWSVYESVEIERFPNFNFEKSL